MSRSKTSRWNDKEGRQVQMETAERLGLFCESSGASEEAQGIATLLIRDQRPQFFPPLSKIKSMSEAPSPALEDLQFWGSPNEDVSAFLGSIKRAAIKQGRHLDNEWMISYAESCLRGDAMKWFDEMDPDEPAATEWRSLRKAFLGRFTYPPPPATATALVRKHEMPRAPLPATVSDDFGGFKLKWFKKAGIIITSICVPRSSR
ncbi:hypothetical protein FRB94_012714 [Tulasnella sp. JGI-2019a]|nr:hypothetical protein FRB94_012714 [Tulasnella sp. JGI-2019a]